jgi:hypothetical protein
VTCSVWVSPAAGQSDPVLTVTTTANYSVVPESGRVEVDFGYVFENTTEAIAFPGFFESIPVDAVSIVAADGDGELLSGPTGENEGFETWLVAFDEPLEPGESLDVTVSWAIVGESSLPGAIVEAGAASFDIYTPGPSGSSWSAPTIEVPPGFVAVSAATPENPYELVRVEFISVDSFFAEVRSLPPELSVGDWKRGSVWTASVFDRAEAVTGSLESWFGPRTEPVAVRRVFPGGEHPAVSANLVELASDDAEAVDHQMAHAWLADVPVEEPWFVEGLAAAFAGDQAVPSGPADVVPVVVNEIGAAGVRAVVDALRSQSITYPGVVAEVQPVPADWRTILDHLEGVGGADGVAALFRTAVVDASDVPLLDRRAAARLDYDALEFHAGGWTLPPYLREAMASWEFETFTALQGPVSDAILRRDSLLEWAESLELAPRNDGKAIFEAAESGMNEVSALLDEQEAALEAFDEAERLVNGDRGLLAGIGLLGQDADADLAELRVAWADGEYDRVENDGHELVSLVEGAVGDGTIRLLVPIAAAIGLWQLVRWIRRRVQRPRSVVEHDEEASEA